MTNSVPQNRAKEAKRLLHECDRNVRYHTARRDFLDQWNKILIALTILSGSAAIASIKEVFWKDTDNIYSILVMLIPVLAGTMSLVFNLGVQARNHEILMQRFLQIQKRIDVFDSNTSKIQEWRELILDAYHNEPPVYNALNADCYNEASKALEVKPAKLMHLTALQRLLRNWVRYSGTTFNLRDVKYA